MEIVLISRGRGRGHAVPDLAILSKLRKMHSPVSVRAVSYGTGAKVFREAGEHVLDLDLEDMTPPKQIVAAIRSRISDLHCDLAIVHEEFLAVPLARAMAQRVIYITHWYHLAGDPMNRAVAMADRILFIGPQRAFREPRCLQSKVELCGPVLRTFSLSLSDRSVLRQKLGLKDSSVAIGVFPGSWGEDVFSIRELVISAFKSLQIADKHLFWLAGGGLEGWHTDSTILNDEGIHVLTDVQTAESLMIACDIAVTKGTFNTLLEAYAFGLPTVTLSLGRNSMDDYYARRLPSNDFLFVREISTDDLRTSLERGIAQGRYPPVQHLLSGEGASRVAACIVNEFKKRESLDSSGNTNDN